MTDILQGLIQQASTELGSTACQAGKHTWVGEGGRSCPHDLTDHCGQAVYRCSICGTWDYGGPGGPGHADCEMSCQLREERILAIAKACVDPLGQSWHQRHSSISRKLRHHLLLRALRRQAKPRLP